MVLDLVCQRCEKCAFYYCVGCEHRDLQVKELRKEDTCEQRSGYSWDSLLHMLC